MLKDAEDQTSVPPTEDKTEDDGGVSQETQVDVGSLESSTSEQDDNNSTESSGVGTNDDKSEQEEKPEDFVAKVLEAQEDSSTSSEDDSNQEAGTKSDADTDDQTRDDEINAKTAEGEDQTAKADEEIPDKFSDHPAWKRIISARDDAEKQVEALQGDATSFQQIASYMETNRIPAEELLESMQLLALRNSNPEEFYQKVFVDLKDQMDQQLGFVLSPELQGRVDQGLITQEDAIAQSRAIAKANFYKDQVNVEKTVRARDQETRQQEQVVDQTKQSEQAVNAWETSIRSSDPDYDIHLKPFVEDRLTALLTQHRKQGTSITPEVAVQLAENAYKTVVERYKAGAPKRKAMTPGPKTGGVSKVGNNIPEDATPDQFVSQILGISA